MSRSAIQKAFLSSPLFAVAGASKDQNKYGSKLLNWYITRNKIVTPLHPKEDVLAGIATVRSLSDIEDPQSTSLSIVTPPKVTLSLLQDASRVGIPYVWLQPGAEDDEVVDYVKSDQYLKDKVVYGGPCVLASGDSILSKL